MRSILAPGFFFPQEDNPLDDPAVLLPRVQEALDACESWADLEVFCADTRAARWPVSFACGQDRDDKTRSTHYMLLFHCDGVTTAASSVSMPDVSRTSLRGSLAETAVIAKLSRETLVYLARHLVP